MATTDKPPVVGPLVDLTAFQRDILVLLSGMGSTHGLGVKHRLEELYGDEVNHGRLYPNLDNLVELGLIEKGEIDRRTNSYSLTDRGRREVKADFAWRTECIEEDSE